MANTFRARLVNLRMKDINGVWRFPDEFGTFYLAERERVGSQFFEEQVPAPKPVRKAKRKTQPKPKASFNALK